MKSCASVQTVQGAEDVKAEATSGLPQLQIKPDRAAIARYGLNVEDVNDLVESIVAGKQAGQVFEGEQRFNLVVRLNEDVGTRHRIDQKSAADRAERRTRSLYRKSPILNWSKARRRFRAKTRGAESASNSTCAGATSARFVDRSASQNRKRSASSARLLSEMGRHFREFAARLRSGF